MFNERKKEAISGEPYSSIFHFLPWCPICVESKFDFALDGAGLIS